MLPNRGGACYPTPLAYVRDARAKMKNAQEVSRRERMAEHPTLQATVRTVVGKKVKRLRRQGQTPAVLYGPVVSQPLPITVDARAFAQVYHRAGTTSLVDILLDGQVYSVFIREVAIHPVSREVQNVEFYAPDL